MPIHVQVRYFAVLRERLRMDEQALELPEGATVRDALDALAAQHDTVATLRGRFQTAVNMTMAPPDTVLTQGDELALIPPVAGGAPDDAEDARRRREQARGAGETGGLDRPAGGAPDDAEDARLACMVHDRAPSLDRCVAAVKSADMGAVVTFTGCVRRHNQGREVERLEYEAYDAMANKVLSELCDAIEAEIPGARLAVEHRAGKLVVGDIAVVIAAGAPHRAEAFQACREMIERLKQAVPIWKKEIGPDGAEWLGIGP